MKSPLGRPSASGEPRPRPGDHSQPERLRRGRTQHVRQPGPIPAKNTAMSQEVTFGKSIPGGPRSSRPLPNKPMPGRPVPGKPMPGRPVPGKPMPGKPVEARTRAEITQPGKRSSTPDGPKPGAKSPGQAPHSPRLRLPPEGVEQESSPQVKPSRKIIGLDPKVAAQAGLLISGRPARKRPAGPRRPPRRVFGIKREGNGEDES
jgi:hypothetical protein